MLLLLSVVLVLGAVGVFVGNVAGSEQGELRFGFQQMIHARIPWLLLAAALGGTGLGVVSLLRRRRWYAWAIVPAEALLAGLLTWYLLSASFLPPHALAVSPGEPFPGYALADQDGVVHSRAEGDAGAPALYIFYRGDW